MTASPASTLMRRHAGLKLWVLAREPRAVPELGRLAAAGDVAAYDARLSRLAGVEPTARTHANALLHAAGHLRTPDADLTRRIHAVGRGEAGAGPVAQALLDALRAEGGHAWAVEQTYWASVGAQ